MGLATFRQGSSTGAGGVLLYRMKPLPLVSQIYGWDGTSQQFHVPVVRSGAGTKSFKATANTDIVLYTQSSAGVPATTASISYTTYLTSSTAVAFHMNSADTCLYVLLRAGTSYRAIKIDDSTGVVTTIGSSFTPATTGNWPTIMTASMEIDSVSGHLKIICNGFSHSLHKTTGAIVTQDVAVPVGTFLGRKLWYKTQDGTVGVSAEISSNIPTTIHATYGNISGYSIPSSSANGILSSYESKLDAANFILVDNDKVINGTLAGNQNTSGVKVYSRTDFDKYIKSIAELGAGVI
jgi:hypothetical protein